MLLVNLNWKSTLKLLDYAQRYSLILMHLINAFISNDKTVFKVQIYLSIKTDVKIVFFATDVIKGRLRLCIKIHKLT